MDPSSFGNIISFLVILFFVTRISGHYMHLFLDAADDSPIYILDVTDERISQRNGRTKSMQLYTF